VQERIQLLELRRRHAALRDIERTTMAAMVAGKLNKQLALELRIAERTVKKHRATVLKQMGAASLADLVRMAIRLQLA
jgi:FixJ family two-component response regulator